MKIVDIFDIFSKFLESVQIQFESKVEMSKLWLNISKSI